MSYPRITEDNHIDKELGAAIQYISAISHASPLHDHDYHEFFLVVKGSCIHYVNHQKQYLSEGALVFIRPEDNHSYGYDNESDCEFINIAYSGEVIQKAFDFINDDNIINDLINNEMPVYNLLSPLEKDDFLRSYEKIRLLASIDKRLARLHIRSFAVEILTRYFLCAYRGTQRCFPPWFEDVLMQMQKKNNFTIGLSRLYEISGRSAVHLNRVFRRYLDCTPTEYINRLRIGYAKDLLMNSKKSVLYISLEAGFGNLSHFNHTFKRQLGASPCEVRRSLWKGNGEN
jgi:AraC family transcriptional regulator, dual regulator of chb operon